MKRYENGKISIPHKEMVELKNSGKLNLGIEIFKGNYHKSFLHELISGQIDMDRLDYLNRDSFFTGVAEGVVSYDRIITMLNVRDNRLVIEEKGIYSIEKFLVARRFMYWQVYLHKTGIAAEQMLIAFMKKLKNTGLSTEWPLKKNLENLDWLRYYLKNFIVQIKCLITETIKF